MQRSRLRLLPHLVHHYHIWVGPTLNQTTACPVRPRAAQVMPRIVALSSLSRFTITSRLLAHSSHPRIASIHPSSTLAATRSKALSHRALHPHGRRSGSPKTRRPMPQTLATSKSLSFHVAHVVHRPSLVRPRSGFTAYRVIQVSLCTFRHLLLL